MAHEDALMASGGFDPMGSTNLFPSLSEPGLSFQFAPNVPGDRAPGSTKR